MLVFTNRAVLAGQQDESAFTARFKAKSDALGMADAVRNAGGGASNWQLSSVTANVSDAAAMAALVKVFQAGKPVLVHLHGNNMKPAECFERCARFEECFGVAVVGFSWPSEGLLASGKNRAGVLPAQAQAEDRWTLAAVTAANHATSVHALGVIARYRRAKTNARQSAAAIARFFMLVGKARAYAENAPFSVAAHSLGVYCLQQLPKAGSDLPEMRNLALLAACVARRGHVNWVSRLPRSGVLLVTTNVSDWVLFGALYADRGEEKLGAAYVVPPMVGDPDTRYVDFARRSPGEHEYFIAERGAAIDPDLLALFERVFASRDDIAAGEDPCDVYRGCCDALQRVCDVG